MVNFIVFTGYLGSGKTLGATIFAHYYQNISGCALYSNCGIANSKPFTSLDDFKKIAVEESSVLVLDEAHVDLDARSFNANSVKFFSQLAYFLRKLRCTLILTSPAFVDLDQRIRGVTNILATVSKDKYNFYYELYDIQSQRYLRTLVANKTRAFNATDDLYDTNAMVVPITVPDSKGDYFEFLNELKEIAENYNKRGAAVALATVAQN